jgi:hypothetical protein
MRRLIENFVHKLGVHCESSAIRDVLNYYGLEMSEDMVFGLDCTFGFLYWKEKVPYRPFYISGKINTFPNTLPKFLGIRVIKKTTNNPTEAWKAIKDLIDKNVAVPVFVDMYYIDYMQIPREPWNHFGNHVIVLVGYDEEKAEAYVADSAYKDIQSLPLKSLTEARNSKFEPCPPENTWFEIHVPKTINPIGKAAKMAIGETAENTLNPPQSNYGVKGIKSLAEDIVEWPKCSPVMGLKLALFLQYIDLEVAGTGGGNFRKIYSRFLKEAAKLLRNEELDNASERIAQSANLWSETANLILRSSQKEKIGDVKKPLAEAQLKLIQCAEIEEETFRKLLAL